VFVDGRDLGAPPVVIRDIDPDTHIVRVTGPGQSYEPYQETVRLEPGEARSLGPVRLKLLRGKLELLPGDGADGAKITVDGRRVSHLPATLELSADQSHEVLAQRRGFADFSEEVVFDGSANRSLEVSLSPGASSDTERPRTSRVSSSTTSAKRASAAAPDSGKTATLDVVSTPPSNVVINGRPMGSTPLRNVRVPAGQQTVVFVHASLGRKIASTAVAPGGHGTVGVKF
jgi:serine/threonine-protein kinase